MSAISLINTILMTQRNDLADWIAITISVITLVLTISLSLYLGNQQIRVSEMTRKFEIIKFYEDRKDNSKRITGDLFDKMYEPGSALNQTREKIRNGTKVQEAATLLRFVDVIDDVWYLYCDGQINKEDIQINLKRSMLDNSCYNSQIIEQFKNQKNWFSLLCSLYRDPTKQSMGEYYKTTKHKCIPLEERLKEIRGYYAEVGITWD